MATRDELKSKASQIKNEVEEGRNTANRVGGLLEDMVDSLATNEQLDTLGSNVSQLALEVTGVVFDGTLIKNTRYPIQGNHEYEFTNTDTVDILINFDGTDERIFISKGSTIVAITPNGVSQMYAKFNDTSVKIVDTTANTADKNAQRITPLENNMNKLFVVPFDDNKKLSASENDRILNDDKFFITDFIEIPSSATSIIFKCGYDLIFSNSALYVYTENKVFIDKWGEYDRTFTKPSGAKYIRFTVRKGYEGKFACYADGVEFWSAKSILDKINGKIYEGKKWVCVGDSLTDSTNSYATKRYFDYVAEDTGIFIVNFGVSGTGYKRTEESNTAFYQRVSSIPTDADVITIFGSGNDKNLPFGNYYDTDTNSVCGCVNKTIDNILSIMPTANIGIITPTPWLGYTPIERTLICNGSTSANVSKRIAGNHTYHVENIDTDDIDIRFYDSNNTEVDRLFITSGTKQDYTTKPTATYFQVKWRTVNLRFIDVNQSPDTPQSLMEVLSEKLVEIGKFRGIPVLDLFHNSQLRPNEKSFRDLAFDADGVHLNNIGHKMIYPRFKEFLYSLL